MIFSGVRIFLAVLWTMFFSTLVLLGLPFNKGGVVFNWLGRRWSRGILRVCGVRVQLEGSELVHPSRNYVYVSNHASMFDIPAVLATIPGELRMVVKKELGRIPVFGWALRYGGYVNIDRGQSLKAMRSIEAAAERIRNGASVLLFAEGTRTRTGKLQPFKRGAFNLAVKAGVPIVPLTINGSYRIMPKSTRQIHPGTIVLKLSEPIATNGYQGRDGENKLLERVHRVIAEQYEDQSES